MPPSEKARGKRNYCLFQAVNTFSFIILSGDFIILYLLKLGAGSYLVGLASSFKYLSFLFMFAGRALLPRMGTRRVMGVFWMIRYICMSLAIFSPVFTAVGRVKEGILLTLAALLGSQVARGIGLVGFKPVIGAISNENERGDFLSRLEIITYSMSISIGLITAFLIGRDAPLERYTVFLGVGIGMGLFASFVILRFPDPPYQNALAGTGVFRGIQEAFRRPGFGYFTLILFITSFSLGSATPFLVVYVKSVYARPDSIVLFLTVAGSAGAVLMGMITRLVIDRLGAKPMFILFNLVFAISIVPMILSPDLSSVLLLVLLGSVFFLFQMGFSGSQNAAQNYFFSVVEPAEHLNLGILFNVVSGIGSAVGALSGGLILHLLENLRGPGLSSFRIFWLFSLGLAGLSILLMGRLKPVSKYSVRDSLSILFSPRDMKAVSLLKRLSHSTTAGDEVKVIKALADTPSEVAVDDLVQRLKHPRYYVRSRALIAMEHLPFDDRLEAALQAEIKNHEYTTAYMAARLLGKKGSKKNRHVLRKALQSEDYLLQANAALALGRLGDSASVPALEKLVSESENPLVIILAASALEMTGSTSSPVYLLTALQRKNPPPFLRDELFLSLSGILGMGEWFYPFYKAFLEKAGSGFLYLKDYLDTEARQKGRESPDVYRYVAGMMTMNRADFLNNAGAAFAGLREHMPEEICAFVTAALDNPELMKFDRLVFLLTAFFIKTLIGVL